MIEFYMKEKCYEIDDESLREHMIIVNWVFTIVFLLLFVIIVYMSCKVFKISGYKNHMLTAMIIIIDLSALFLVFFYAL